MHVAIVGAGIGGLSAAIRLALAGARVSIHEMADAPGGKMRQVAIADRWIDVGPTVLTLRSVFADLFSAAGERLEDHLNLVPSPTIARHVFPDGSELDLFTDHERSREAVTDFAGSRAAAEFDAFMKQAGETYRLLQPIFMTAERPSGPLELTMRAGFAGLGSILRLGANQSLGKSLEDAFTDQRLRQLFGRYATYVGSSPFAAPATLRLIAHVESSGVWLVEGGMARLAKAVADLAERCGVSIHYGRRVESIEVTGGRASGLVLDNEERVAADVVVAACDADALSQGLLGKAASRALDDLKQDGRRSLSALTMAAIAQKKGRPLLHHNVFFGGDPQAEFRQIFHERRLPQDPTVYVCAQDRGPEGEGASDPPAPERLFLIVNAPPESDGAVLQVKEIERCVTAILSKLEASGLTLDSSAGEPFLSTPSDFSKRFPGTGGALYGRASHGSMASFQRPGARTRLRGLYLCGGSVHPGAGVPMASISGNLAAAAIMKDHASISPFRRVAMPGGIATRSRTTVGSA